MPAWGASPGTRAVVGARPALPPPSRSTPSRRPRRRHHATDRARCADDDVVHGALGRGGHPVRDRSGQGPEAHVGHPLADLDVAGTDRGREPSVDDRALRRDHPHGAMVPALAGRVWSTTRAQHEGDRGHRHRLHRIGVARALGIGAGEVELDPPVIRAAARRAHGAADDRRSLLVGPGAGRVHDVLGPPLPHRQHRQRGAAPSFAVGQHLGERGVGQLGQAPDPHGVGPDLGVEVAGPLHGVRELARIRDAVRPPSAGPAAGAAPPAGSRWRRPGATPAPTHPRPRGGPGWRPSPPGGRRPSTVPPP